MADLCTGCDIPSWQIITKFHGDIDDNAAKATKFLRDHGVLPSEVICKYCETPCQMRKGRHQWYCYRYKCISAKKKRQLCNFSQSDYKGTFLEGTHLEPWKILLFVNHWLEKNWSHDTIYENLKFSTGTVLQWRIWCSKVTDFWWRSQGAIGGEGITVEISIYLFIRDGEEQQNRDKDHTYLWLFGGMERESKKVFVVPHEASLDDAMDKDTLICLIRQYIHPGTVVVSDSLDANLTLTDYGYRHLVNHSRDSVGKENSVAHTGKTENTEAHTENIEWLWQDMKKWVIRPGIRPKYYCQYISHYLFLHNFPKQRLHRFLIEAARMCPPLHSKRPKPSSS